MNGINFRLERFAFSSCLEMCIRFALIFLFVYRIQAMAAIRKIKLSTLAMQ